MPVDDPDRRSFTIRLTRESRRALDAFIAMHGGDATAFFEAIAKRLAGLGDDLPALDLDEIVQDARLIHHERRRRGER